MFADATPVGSALEQLDRALTLLEAESGAAAGECAWSALVLELAARSERLRAITIRAIAGWDVDRSWELDGARSAPSWLTANTRASKAEARQLVRSARLARCQPQVGAALAAGELAPTQLDALANATRGRSALLARDVDTLVGIAPALSTDDYTTALKHWRSAADDEMAREDAHRAFEQRSVTWATTLDGRVELHASLDAEGGAIVVKAIEAYDRPDPEPTGHESVDGSLSGPADGPRTLAQRLADGLVQLSSEALARHEEARHHVPGIDALIDVERLAGHSFAAPHSLHAFDPATGEVLCSTPCCETSALADWLHRRCELAGIGPVARDVLLRVACDAAVGRIVMRGRSEVLDLGRRTRVPSRALRRAIEVRDRQCTFPGCDAPMRWCDVHHLVHWADGGATDLVNCTLLCRRHHVLCHEGGWALGRDPDGRIVITRRGGRPRRRRRGPPPRHGGGYDLAA